MSDRDTIFVVGTSASGKTQILNQLRDQIGEFGIEQELKPHSDSHTILDWMRKDDRENDGRNHYHPWCLNAEEHDHSNGEKELPFTVAGNFIYHGMQEDFWAGLRDLPRTRVIRYAEWAGGVNINDPSDRASLTDASFGTMGGMLLDGRWPTEGLQRVLAVFHAHTDFALRMELNANRGEPTEEEIEFGIASWSLIETGMKIYGKDDFHP